jgi:hypothetical protein
MEDNDMKKAFIFFVLVMAVLGSLAAQNSDYAQMIIGTWIDTEGQPWEFGFDEEGYFYYVYDGETTFEWSECEVDGATLILYEVSFPIRDAGRIVYDSDEQIYNISFSSDGRTLYLTGGKRFAGWSVAGPGWTRNELTRRASR